MRYLFDGYVIDLDRRELRRDTANVPVEPQVLDLLAYLIEHRDQVVSKDELIATVWKGRIVSESTLATRVSAARGAVGDSGKAQRLIRTYPRKGVRFVGEARVEGGDVAAKGEGLRSPDRGKPCVAVLPFAGLPEAAGQDYFADGISEDILTELSRNRAIRVIARSPAFAFRGQVDLREVGRVLGADYVVDGSVRRSGDGIRVTVRISETDGGGVLWTERYDRPLRDLFQVQDDIASSIVARLDPEVGVAEEARAARKLPSTFEAWDLFRLGTRAFHKSSAEDNVEAQGLFMRAIERDPSLAQAYGYLAYAIVLGMIYFDADPDRAKLEEAVAIGRKGVEADDRDALVRFMYGRALLARGDYAAALEQLSVARDLNPSLAVVHCGLADSLAYDGRVAEAIPHFQAALALSPHDPMRWAFLSYRSLAHIFAREFGEAAHWAQKATQVPRCHYWAFAHRVCALGHTGGGAELDAAVAELARRRTGFTIEFARRRLFFVTRAEQVSLYLEGLRKANIPPS